MAADEVDDGRVPTPADLDALSANAELPLEESRQDGVWTRWLESLVSDSESALAAAMAYREMNGQERSTDLTSIGVWLPLQKTSSKIVLASCKTLAKQAAPPTSPSTVQCKRNSLFNTS